jgi:hypothetical protein
VEAASATQAPLVRDGDVPATPISPRRPGTQVWVAAAIAGAVHCGCCSRAPLVGETVSLRVRGNTSRWVCEVCEHARRWRPLGRELRRERVRSVGGALNVRRAR